MKLDLEGDVAVIVGGARGIGRAVALAFAAEGAKVVVVDLAPLEEAHGDHSSATFHKADVADLAAIRRVAHAIGRCDHLVYAAGVGSGAFGFPFWNVEPELWDRVLRVNLMGAVHSAHAFAPAMAEAGRGTILFIASVAGQIGSQTDPPYSASKAALINFAQCAARDLAPRSVRVNTINPGMIRTTLNHAVYDAWAKSQPATAGPAPSYEEWGEAKVKALVPLGRWQTPEDVAAAAVFLASPRAGNVAGQTINVDGGYVMHR
jgi:NAD(P)-dependent dehydrogenase (short-subunit alcohol dehydrogenase family)